MSERKITGVIEKYSEIEVGTKKDDKETPFAYVDIHLLDNKYPNRFFFTSAEEIKEKLIDKVPIGSTIEFNIFKTNKFWNVDKKSFKVLFKGDGTVPKSQRENRYDKTIIRQNALRHADAKRQIKELNDKEYFKFAEDCENWIMRD